MQCLNGCTRKDGEENIILLDTSLQLQRHSVQVLRLDGEDDDVSSVRCRHVVLRHLNTIFRMEGIDAELVGVTRDNLEQE